MFSRSCAVLVLLGLLAIGAQAGKLQVSGDHFTVNGQKVFLSGPNIAWYDYGNDFGNNRYDVTSGTLESWLQSIADNGGNCVRFWLHVEGYYTPKFDSNGFVTGMDNTGSLINDMKRYLDAAQARDIVVIFVLWNGAYVTNQNLVNLVWDNSKLQSYIDNALKPMVSGLAGHPALGAWEIMNEPEGSVLVQSHSDSCADTTALQGTGAGWTGVNWPMDKIQLFTNWQADAIRSADPGALITLGSWSESAQTNAMGKKNYYTNECLTRIGGRSGGYIDFYQMHTYAHGGAFASTAPFKHQAPDYALDKPLVIGEFAAVCSENNSESQLMDYLYFNGYHGGLTWHYAATGDCSDSQDVQNQGFKHISTYNDANNGGLVNFDV